jgi:hypothetical protein
MNDKVSIFSYFNNTSDDENIEEFLLSDFLAISPVRFLVNRKLS